MCSRTGCAIKQLIIGNRIGFAVRMQLLGGMEHGMILTLCLNKIAKLLIQEHLISS
jgi:hypothetical protein